ncbi:hypothetical protein J1N35_037751 [Gossypium stocksii]|uniref:Uncharacterized protein n=1 Tax=Gossypium stocksii TaxID=47602 RepID=A0A9D3ZM29_9ROSI|nr:hypothetical protein J1N35_037751 [Gossypium stocksii]
MVVVDDNGQWWPDYNENESDNGLIGVATVTRSGDDIRCLVNVWQKPDTPVKYHIITLMVYFDEATDNKANLDQNTQIEVVLKSLTKNFVGFKVAYNFGDKKLKLAQLMKELQSYELVLNDSQLV